jgi:hypothetical protein
MEKNLTKAKKQCIIVYNNTNIRKYGKAHRSKVAASRERKPYVRNFKQNESLGAKELQILLAGRP